jgi:hypothetical protein
MNAQRVTITMRDGSAFRGYINIGSCRRLSDFFRKSESQFIVVFEATIGEGKEKGVYFLNWNHILWVEPNETEGQERFTGSLNPESEPK